MTRIVLIFGAIAGAIVSAMLFITVPLYKSGTLKFENGQLLGYTTMVIALSMIFIGIKSYRDNHLNGVIKFGKAFQVGLFIAAIASILYAIAWEVNLHFFYPDFMDVYVRQLITKAQENGTSAEKLDKLIADAKNMQEMYSNPFVRFGITLLEIFPVGLLISLVSAAILKRKGVLPA